MIEQALNITGDEQLKLSKIRLLADRLSAQESLTINFEDVFDLADQSLILCEALRALAGVCEDLLDSTEMVQRHPRVALDRARDGLNKLKDLKIEIDE